MEMIKAQSPNAAVESIRAMRMWKSDAREVTPELRYPSAHHPVRKMEPHMAAQLMQTLEKDIAVLIDNLGTMERSRPPGCP